MKWIKFLAFFTPLHVFAQSAILENPDIVWAAYITQDWEMEHPLEKEWDAGVITIKNMPKHSAGLQYSTPIFTELLFEAIESHKLEVFDEPDCKTPITMDSMVSKMYGSGENWVVTFDPVTYEEQIVICKSEIFFDRDFTGWRTHSILYYNSKLAAWGVEVMAMAPLMKSYVKSYENPEIIPLFWFKPINRPRNIGNKEITWAKKTFSGATEQTTIFLAPDSLVKVTPGFEHPYQHYVEAFANKRRSVFYDSRMEHKLSMADRKNMLVNRDSLLEFDPETYETYTVIIPPKVKSENVTQLRLVQIWAWDAEKSRLYIWLDAVAPLYIRDLNIKIGRSWSFPLFYQKVRR
ncbi:MAG TPA: hypothetical protein VK168_01660 [Saprospiraceae bacterium]|nr:hypothetical protein [Saprospiraceae bacterium]